MLNID